MNKLIVKNSNLMGQSYLQKNEMASKKTDSRERVYFLHNRFINDVYQMSSLY